MDKKTRRRRAVHGTYKGPEGYPTLNAVGACKIGQRASVTTWVQNVTCAACKRALAATMEAK
jgi:hypothetical protein